MERRNETQIEDTRAAEAREVGPGAAQAPAQDCALTKAEIAILKQKKIRQGKTANQARKEILDLQKSFCKPFSRQDELKNG